MSSVREAPTDPARRLKVGFRVGPFPKLSETFILNQIENMARNGHIVSVLADSPSAPGDTGKLPSGPLQVRYIQPGTGTGELTRRYMPYRLRQFMAARAERHLAKQNDVVICHFGWFGARMISSAGHMAKRGKIITVFHGKDMSSHPDDTGPAIYEELFRHGDLFLPVSEHWRQALLQMGAPDHCTSVHHMGVDLNCFPFNERLQREDQDFRLLTICRLVEKKGIEFALRAISICRQAAPQKNITLDIIGEGPDREPLERIAADLNIRHAVRFRGFLPHKDISEAMRLADAFILPSVTAIDGDMEGIPVVLMEACATGLPVISTFHSGIPELIEHGVTGLLANERDFEALAGHILTLASDQELGRQFARSARTCVETKFNSAKLSSELNSIVQKLVR